MPIEILSEHLASQIAAGEVVERPASVVKELIENALDAGAQTVNVDIRNGGQELIQVADDGQGIAAAEVEQAFRRHATSKLQSPSDLDAIGTLGFRGEALAAIAAVSRVTIVTRPSAQTAGIRLVLEAGTRHSRDQVGAPQGTVIAVENLFYNVPARRKFLKSISTEKRHIDEFVTRYALAYPDVRFRLAHDGRVTFQSNGTGEVRDVLVSVYGVDIARELLEIQKRDDPGEKVPLSVHGFVGPPGLHRANRSQITLFVNGRWIKDNSLTYAVIQAYHTLLPTGRYPVAVLFLEIPFAQVDVNVHPAKSEVRFRNGNAAFAVVQRAVRRTVVNRSPARTVALGAAPTSWSGNDWRGDKQSFSRQRAEGDQTGLALDWAAISASNAEEAHEGAAAAGREVRGERLPILRIVGQVGASYIIAEGPDGMFLVDQHAAHERILYERFMAARDAEAIPSQGLVASATVQLTPDQASLLEEKLPLLNRLGFQVEPFGHNSFVVRAIPALLSRLDPAAALAAVVEDIESGKQPLEEKIEAQVILRVCKTAAVKAGQSLSLEEMEAMMRQLERCTNPHTCPHGRPTLIHLSAAQLARQFGRT